MAHQLLDEFMTVIHYSDITYESLKDKDFAKELKRVGLIDEDDAKYLAVFGKGVSLIN